MFDLQVHNGLHRRIARVSENAASPQSPWAKFHPSLKPPHHFARSQIISDTVQEHRFIESMVRNLLLHEMLFDLFIGEGWAKKTPPHLVPGCDDPAWLLLKLMPSRKRSANR